MFERVISLTVLAVLAGCAGTQKAAVEPAPVAEIVQPAVQPVVSLASEAPPAQMLVVADVTPPTDEPKPAAPQAAVDPYQCMLAWAKGMQDALVPWTHTAQACDTRTPKP